MCHLWLSYGRRVVIIVVIARQTNDYQVGGKGHCLVDGGWWLYNHSSSSSRTGKLVVTYSNLTANTAKRSIIISLIGQLLCVCLTVWLSYLYHYIWSGNDPFVCVCLWYTHVLGCGVDCRWRRQTKRGHGGGGGSSSSSFQCDSICPPFDHLIGTFRWFRRQPATVAQ